MRLMTQLKTMRDEQNKQARSEQVKYHRCKREKSMNRLRTWVRDLVETSIVERMINKAMQL